MRNSFWTRDELVLTLDLYFSLRTGEMHVHDPKITELSVLLNRLPRFAVGLRAAKLRPPPEVWLKLCDFRTIDPNYRNQGFTPVSELDRSTFERFAGNQERLTFQAERLREVARDDTVCIALSAIENNAEEAFETGDGGIILGLHKLVERSNSLIRERKLLALDESGSLTCQVCGFDFAQRYGPRGFGYIECHHRTPLAELSLDTRTTLADLALVCANCHRMLHRSGILTVEELRQGVQS